MLVDDHQPLGVEMEAAAIAAVPSWSSSPAAHVYAAGALIEAAAIGGGALRKPS